MRPFCVEFMSNRLIGVSKLAPEGVSVCVLCYVRAVPKIPDKLCDLESHYECMLYFWINITAALMSLLHFPALGG